MVTDLRGFKVPSLVALLAAALTIAACGGESSEEAATANLAKYMPADALFYMEGTVRPEQDLADNVESLSTRLTGTSLSETIDEALNNSSDTDVTYEADVEPWLGENAAMFVSADIAAEAASVAAADPAPGEVASVQVSDSGNDGEKVGLVAESTDVDASQSFIDKAAEEDGSTDGEYEGFSYKISNDDDSVLGIVDDNVVFATSVEVFESMVDASNGDSLEGTSAFGELVGNAPDGSLINMYVANDPILEASKEGTGGLDLNQIYEAMGVDLSDTGTLMSIVPTENEISMVGSTNADAPFESGDPTALVETFPADSLFATGSGDVGANVTKVIDAIDEEGIEGVLEPGELKKNLNEASGQGLDVLAIVEDLETVGMFVSGTTERNLGGALVATTSNPEPIGNALGAFSSLIRLAEDAQVRALGGDLTGFSVRTPELPGRPIIIALKDDRLVVGIGMAAAMQALNITGQTLADSAAYKAAAESLSGENVDMFANPGAIGNLIRSAAAGVPDAAEIADVMDKFEFMVSGSGSEDKTFEFNVGVKD